MSGISKKRFAQQVYFTRLRIAYWHALFRVWWNDVEGSELLGVVDGLPLRSPPHGFKMLGQIGAVFVPGVQPHWFRALGHWTCRFHRVISLV